MIELYEPTNALRWLDLGETKVLQQAWVGQRSGLVNWRSIPIVTTKDIS